MLLNLEKTNKVNNFDEKYFLYFESRSYVSIKNKEKVLFLTKLKIKHEELNRLKMVNEIKNVRVWHYMWSMFYFIKKI